MDWKYLFTSFQGRINRAKFWAGVGVMIGISIVLSLIDALLGLQIGTGDGAIGILGLIWALISIYLGLAASSSLLIATITLESFMPARCWIAPEMPQAM